MTTITHLMNSVTCAFHNVSNIVDSNSTFDLELEHLSKDMLKDSQRLHAAITKQLKERTAYNKQLIKNKAFREVLAKYPGETYEQHKRECDDLWMKYDIEYDRMSTPFTPDLSLYNYTSDPKTAFKQAINVLKQTKIIIDNAERFTLEEVAAMQMFSALQRDKGSLHTFNKVVETYGQAETRIRERAYQEVLYAYPGETYEQHKAECDNLWQKRMMEYDRSNRPKDDVDFGDYHSFKPRNENEDFETGFTVMDF